MESSETKESQNCLSYSNGTLKICGRDQNGKIDNKEIDAAINFLNSGKEIKEVLILQNGTYLDSNIKKEKVIELFLAIKNNKHIKKVCIFF